MSKIIAFVGFKQTGKSTAAKYLEENYGFVRHNFKDALVAEIKEKFPDLLREIARREADWFDQATGDFIPMPIEHLFHIKPPLIRALMINYGTEVRRGDYKGYWTTKWGVNRPNGNIVTDDCRFIDEAESIRKHDGIIIRLTRPDIKSGGDHSSETEQLQIEADHEIKLVPGEVSLLCDELDAIIDDLS